MFGAIGFLPQYQQFVQGADATSSGLLLMPLMIAVTLVSIVVGQLISRTGRYRIYPIAGSILVVAAMLLFATVDVDTSTSTTAVYMVILGAGLGGVMQTSTLIAQNSLSPRDIGAGTGASTFLRNMGSSLGVAILGALYTRQLADMSGITPEALHALPDVARHAFQVAVAGGVASLFLWCGVVCVAGVVAAVFVKPSL
jgi:MFS family permease